MVDIHRNPKQGAPAGALSSPARRYQKAGKAFKAVYYGSVVFPETPTKDAVDKAIKKAKMNYEKGDSLNHRVHIVIGEKTMKVVDHESKADLQVVPIGMLAYCTQDATQPEILVYATRTADTRVKVIIGHVFTVQNGKVAAAVTNTVRQAFAELAPEERSLPNESPYEIIGGGSDTKTFDALYLGYVRVSKQDGAKVIKKAAEVNSVARAKMQAERETRGIRRASLLRGGMSSSQQGITVEEDPITLIITPRSLRIVDRLAGETVFKFLLPAIKFASSTKGQKTDIFGFIVHNERLSLTNCHLFHVPFGEGSVLGKAVGNAISEYQHKFGGLALKGNPWEVSPDEPRSAAPAELYQKQVRRRDLQAVAIIGAGEYGEVYLALQNVQVRTPEGGESAVKVPRAVKMMKSAATQKVKNEYIREAITMLKVGDHENIVRMVGVAVQQAPWLVVLEFVQFGDLRAVLQAYKENSMELTITEMLSLMRQLVAGCVHISSKRIVHMDIAARNVLLSLKNVVKIGDFGMARPMANDGDYIILREKVPLALKWNSIEAMDSRFFSEASDCWSCGVTMWEILTYGEFPYAGVKMETVQNMVRDGLRLSQPPNCPDDLWVTISRCWTHQIKDRWRFQDLDIVVRVLEEKYILTDLFKNVYLNILHVFRYKTEVDTPIRDIGIAVAGGEPQWAKGISGLGSPLVSRRSSAPGERQGSPRFLTGGRRSSGMDTGSPKGAKKTLFGRQKQPQVEASKPEMRHLDFASIPNFNAGSASQRVKAQGHLRGHLPFE
eukprot:m.143760 g.143760  ORF g.143760 m.143760 type:complete len:780 (+) comp14905_c0_seq3:253-2592(+)